jgi:acyl carrier protein
VNDIEEHLNALLVGKFDVPAAFVHEDATLGDLELDSLARVELFITLEERWGITFDEDGGDEAAAAITVAQLVKRIETLAAERLANPGHAAPQSPGPAA